MNTVIFVIGLIIAGIFGIRWVIKSEMKTNPLVRLAMRPDKYRSTINDPQQLDEFKKDLTKSAAGNLPGIDMITGTGRVAFWSGIFQIFIVIPVYYVYLYLQPDMTPHNLIYTMVVLSTFELITAAIFIVNGRKLRAITMMNLADARQPLKWLSGAVVAIFILAIGGMIYSKSFAGGSIGLAGTWLAIDIAMSYSVLHIKPTAPETTTASSVPVNNPPTPPVAALKNDKLLMICLGIGFVMTILVIVLIAMAHLVSEKPSSTTSSATSSSSSSPASTTGNNSDKTSSALDAAKAVSAYPDLYSADHNDTYPTQLSQLGTYKTSYPSAAVIATTAITSAPSDPNTVNLYVCKTDGTPSTIARADYWDYTHDKLVQYTGYANTDQHITSCLLLQ